MTHETQLDIHSGGCYPANVLSNFYENAFVLDGVACASMEGLLQSLKTRNVALQRTVCGYSGRKAKMVFHRRWQNVAWKLTGTLYWQGTPMKRSSDDYQRFLDRAYRAMLHNEMFADALRDSAGMALTHHIGKQDTRKTILTEYELVSRLERCRQWVLSSEGTKQ